MRKKRYQIIAAPVCEPMARRLQAKYPERFRFHPTHWGKFPDGTDNIEVGGFQPHNVMAGEHVLLLASFHNNDVTLSQFQVSDYTMCLYILKKSVFGMCDWRSRLIPIRI